jgi:hypothetical protein
MDEEKITVNWKGVGAYVIGIAMSAFLMHNVISKPVCSVAVEDINKDGIEDVITYDDNHQIRGTYLGVKDSSKTITYVEAEKIYQQKQSNLEHNRDSIIQKVATDYNNKIQNLEHEVNTYK